MSALAVDAITLEKTGIPVGAIGTETLIKTTGRAMARAHGYQAYPFVSVPHFIESTDQAVQRSIELALPQVEKVLQKKGA